MGNLRGVAASNALNLTKICEPISALRRAMFFFYYSACKSFSEWRVQTTQIDSTCVRWSFLLMFYHRKTDRISCYNLIILKRSKKPYFTSVSHCFIYCSTLVPSSADLNKRVCFELFPLSHLSLAF